MDIAVHHQLYLQTLSRAVTFGFALHQEDHSDSGAAPQVMSSSPYSVMSRLAVVCGGSRGIGKAVSRLLAERGCRLVVLSRDEAAARATAASLPGGTV